MKSGILILPACETLELSNKYWYRSALESIFKIPNFIAPSGKSENSAISVTKLGRTDNGTAYGIGSVSFGKTEEEKSLPHSIGFFKIRTVMRVINA